METVRFNDNLDMFNSIVLLYKNEKGETYIGASSNMEKDLFQVYKKKLM